MDTPTTYADAHAFAPTLAEDVLGQARATGALGWADDPETLRWVFSSARRVEGGSFLGVAGIRAAMQQRQRPTPPPPPQDEVQLAMRVLSDVQRQIAGTTVVIQARLGRRKWMVRAPEGQVPDAIVAAYRAASEAHYRDLMERAAMPPEERARREQADLDALRAMGGFAEFRVQDDPRGPRADDGDQGRPRRGR